MDYLSFSASRRRRPRAARSRSALKVQYLGAKNALLDNLSLFFFGREGAEERNKNSHKLYKYLQKKDIKNFPETHNWLSRASRKKIK